MPSSLIVPGGRPTPEQLAGPPDPTLPQEPVEVTTAFLVYQLPDGGWWEVSPLDQAELKPQREVTFDDMTAGCANLLDDLCISYPEGEVEVTTAFVVFLLPTGLWQLAPQVDAPLIPSRPPTYTDVRGGLAVTMRDIHTREIAQQTAQATISAQFQVGQAVAQQRENAMLQQKLEADKDKARRGGR